MAQRPKLKLWLLLGLVLIAHAVGLEWMARQRDALTLLATMTPPMYTRMLKPAQPPPVVAVAPAPPVQPPPRVSAPAAPKPKPKASEPERTPEPEAPPVAKAPEPAPPEPAPESAPESAPVPAPVEVAAAPEPEPVAAPARAAASAPAEQGDPLAGWPTDTRLTYRVGGEFRGGPLYGDARVQWQRDGSKYQVRLDIDIKYFTTFTMTSQGDVTPNGLLPRAYEEYRPGKRRVAQFHDNVLELEGGRSAPRPPGMQDTASQFVELAWRFASGREALQPGRTITFPLARPGAVDIWTYDILEREMLRTPELGTLESFHLKPRRITNPRGNITAEMWFAPALQYLPVRIKVLMGDNDYLDLIVEKVEQR